jgi:hypothetical protein
VRERDGRIARDAARLSPGDALTAQLARGSVDLRVERTDALRQLADEGPGAATEPPSGRDAQ